MECTIDWMPGTGMGFVAETGSGHLLTMDGAPDGGGRNLAPRPMETVLAGTGGCTAYDVVLILKRGRHDVRGCQVRLSAERAAAGPEGVHAHPPAFRRQRPRAAGRRGGAGDRAVAREVLFGDDHAGARRPRSRPATRSSRPDPDAGAAGLARRRMGRLARYRRCAVLVITLAAARIAQRTGSGKGSAPARSAFSAWRRSSSFIASTIARDRVSAAGSRSRWPARCCSTWRSVSTTKPRLTRSPKRPASAPMANAPAYHSGFSQLTRSPSSARRCCVHARWSVSSRAASAHLGAQFRAARRQRLRLVERLGADFADMVDAHQRAGQLALFGVAAARRPVRRRPDSAARRARRRKSCAARCRR